MAAKRGRRRDSSFTPALVILNLLIAGIIFLLIFFVYNFLQSEENSPPKRTTPPPRTSRMVTEAETTSVSDITTTEETSLSITKATTTTPAPVTSPETEEETGDIEVNVLDYDINYFLNDLFIGDSIMTGFSGFGFIPAENVFAKVGLNPETVLNAKIDGQTALEKIKNTEPHNIYIMLGTNGLAFMSGEYMAGKLEEFIDGVMDLSTGTQIVILTIPPVTEAHDAEGKETINEINAYNEFLKDLAQRKNCKLADINSLLINSSGYFSEKYAEQDGLHFLGSAYKAVLGYLQHELG